MGRMSVEERLHFAIIQLQLVGTLVSLACEQQQHPSTQVSADYLGGVARWIDEIRNVLKPVPAAIPAEVCNIEIGGDR